MVLDVCGWQQVQEAVYRTDMLAAPLSPYSTRAGSTPSATSTIIGVRGVLRVATIVAVILVVPIIYKS